jgi:hypothetical protein
LCEIDTGPLHLDSENTTFAFFSVIGTRDDGQEERSFQINVRIFDDGEEIYDCNHMVTYALSRSDRVWFYTGSYHLHLKTYNLRVKFKFTNHSALVFFKSCGFHIEHRYEEKATGLMDDDDDDDDVILESSWGPQQKRHSLLQKI